ncbi:hypothetical protein O181_036565 [Austropuccinia psidii MF-1]|uniref:Uncharacterized protein n=1 Tax=Austropuccinia psidii MF-1 TaxID=1389203 RepID=A0A9Q3D969_9BASI|nr:hypothetical protein [Austropuccinia psidii MF-1]
MAGKGTGTLFHEGKGVLSAFSGHWPHSIVPPMPLFPTAVTHQTVAHDKGIRRLAWLAVQARLLGAAMAFGVREDGRNSELSCTNLELTSAKWSMKGLTCRMLFSEHVGVLSTYSMAVGAVGINPPTPKIWAVRSWSNSGWEIPAGSITKDCEKRPSNSSFSIFNWGIWAKYWQKKSTT